MAKFWRQGHVTKAFPRLPVLGRWYAELPTSSVSAERLFGIMRSMEAPQMPAISEKQLTIELMAKVNSSIVDKITVETLLRVDDQSYTNVKKQIVDAADAECTYSEFEEVEDGP